MFWPSNLLGQNVLSLRQGQGKLAADRKMIPSIQNDFSMLPAFSCQLQSGSWILSPYPMPWALCRWVKRSNASLARQSGSLRIPYLLKASSRKASQYSQKNKGNSSKSLGPEEILIMHSACLQ